MTTPQPIPGPGIINFLLITCPILNQYLFLVMRKAGVGLKEKLELCALGSIIKQ